MIIVRVELHSAVTREVTEIARMRICNVGGTNERGNYSAETFRGRSARQLSRMIRQRSAGVENYPRLKVHVWNLVALALAAMRYGGDQPTEPEQQGDLLEEQLQPPQAREPEVVTVPREPTTAMLAAGQVAWLNDPQKRSSTLYRAMVEAAPR
jgi:hypothetical protein